MERKGKVASVTGGPLVWEMRVGASLLQKVRTLPFLISTAKKAVGSIKGYFAALKYQLLNDKR